MARCIVERKETEERSSGLRTKACAKVWALWLLTVGKEGGSKG